MEFKDVASFLGFKEDEFKTLDEFKSKFEGEFVRTSLINEDLEPVKKILGKTFGTLENEVKKLAKAHDLDVDFDADDFKGKKLNEKYKTVFAKYDEKKATHIKDLEAKALLGNDDKVKDMEAKYEKLKNKWQDTDSLLKQTSDEFEKFKQNKESEIKGVKLDVHKKDIFGKAKFVPEANEYTRKGFLNEFQEKYKLDLDENEKPIILDAKGNRIPNPKVTGSFFEPMELLTEEMVKAKLFALNPDGGKKAPVIQVGTQQQNQQQNQAGKTRTVAARL